MPGILSLVLGCVISSATGGRSIYTGYETASTPLSFLHPYSSPASSTNRLKTSSYSNMIVPIFGLFLLSALTSVSAAPAKKSYGCDVSDALLDLPPTTILNIPSDSKPEYIVLGVGTQVSTLAQIFKAQICLSILVELYLYCCRQLHLRRRCRGPHRHQLSLRI
jgi:hypothetical protein